MLYVSATAAIGLAEKPAFVLIQFGHNDSQAPDHPEATDAATAYQECLRQYVGDCRAGGVTPILVTPMHRRTFVPDGKLRDILRPYATATRGEQTAARGRKRDRLGNSVSGEALACTVMMKGRPPADETNNVRRLSAGRHGWVSRTARSGAVPREDKLSPKPSSARANMRRVGAHLAVRAPPGTVRAILTAYGSTSETAERHIFQRGQPSVTFVSGPQLRLRPFVDET